jgi:hypothetical protein
MSLMRVAAAVAAVATSSGVYFIPSACVTKRLQTSKVFGSVNLTITIFHLSQFADLCARMKIRMTKAHLLKNRVAKPPVYRLSRHDSIHDSGAADTKN